MQAINNRIMNDTLYIHLEGRIDSTNAAGIDAEVTETVQAHPMPVLCVDCEKLAYISSAGLRVLLKLKKRAKTISLINVSSEVYEILEMTGFTEIMKVKKAYRMISLDGCETIGKGAKAAVCRYNRDTVVKIYFDPEALPEILRERELARTAFVLGVPTAISYAVVRVEGGGYGLMYELLDTDSLGGLIAKKELTIEKAAGIYIDLLKIIHSTEVDPASMPDMKETALSWADLLIAAYPEDGYEKLREMIRDLPDDNHMLHGDYHINNVMLQNGESLLIDMDSLSHGYPVFEFSGMFNAYIGFGETNHAVVEKYLGISYEESVRFWKESLRLYFDGCSEEKIRAAEEKAMILGYARMLRRMVHRGEEATAEGKLGIENCRRRLRELLARTDTLVF